MSFETIQPPMLKTALILYMIPVNPIQPAAGRRTEERSFPNFHQTPNHHPSICTSVWSHNLDCLLQYSVY